MVKDRPWWILVGGRRRLGGRLAECLAAECNLVLTSGRPWDDDAHWIKELSVRTQVRTLTWNAEAPRLVPTMMADMELLQADGIRFESAVFLAGIFPEHPLGIWEPQSLANLWSLNLSFPLLAAQALVPVMQPGGSLQFVLDTCIHRPFLKRLPYAVSKAGLAAAVAGLAQLLAPETRVVGHALGTLLPAEGSDEDFLEARTLLKRIGTPEDLARAVRYVAASRHLTGDILTLDGGARWS